MHHNQLLSVSGTILPKRISLLRNVDLQEIGADKLFINEKLTAWRAQLFKETRNVKKIYPNGKAWTIDGKIFLKTDFNSKILRINSYDDLKKL